MSSGAGGIGAANSLASILAATSNLQSQYATLQQQTTTGLISQHYAGIASQVGQVLDLTAASAQDTTYTQVISMNQGRASAMQNALGQISSLTTNMASQALQMVGANAGASVSSVAQQAQQDLQQLTSLLDTNYSGAYVFSGADTSNPPVPNPSNITSSGLYTQIGTALAGLGTAPLSTVIASTVSIAASTAAGTSVFSTYLNTPAPTTPSAAPGGLGAPGRQIAISSSQTISLDYPANQNTNAVSDPGINGTGSAIKDILGGLAVLANATPAMASTADFSALMQHVATTLTSANQTVNEQVGAIGIAQDAMTSATNAQSASQLVLKQQINNLTNVDMATAISNMTAVSSQLQTSYQVLSLAKTLNLASFL